LHSSSSWDKWPQRLRPHLIDNLLPSYVKLSVIDSPHATAEAQTGFMEREYLTPGRLYARLSADFRRLRPQHCGNCRMPMVQLTLRASPEACNWAVDGSAPLCERCRPVVAALVKEAAAEFDLRDPISVPYFPRSSPTPGLIARR
jgi:hypothetical protein